MRLTILDGFRGYFLIFMTIVHMNMQFDVIAGKLNHHTFGWVEDAQGFVFISGFVIGLVYGGKLIRRGYVACQQSLMARVRTIYSHQAGLTLIFLSTALILMALGVSLAPQSYLNIYTNRPLETTLGSLMLVSGSLNMGILPMYIWFMLVTPFALKALHAGRGTTVIGLMVCAWILGQTGVIAQGRAFLEHGLVIAGHPMRIGIFFNLLGWQVLFFSGLTLGYMQAAGRLDLSFLRRPEWYTTFKIGLVMFVIFGVLDRIVMDQMLGQDFSEWFLTRQSRRDFTGLYVLAFGLNLFLVTWLVIAGKECGNRVVAWAAVALQWFFTRPFLVFLGQHSLHVFSAHLLLTYGVNLIVQGRALAPLTENLIVALSPLPLYLAAWGHVWLTQHSKRHQHAPSAPGVS